MKNIRILICFIMSLSITASNVVLSASAVNQDNLVSTITNSDLNTTGSEIVTVILGLFVVVGILLVIKGAINRHD